MTQTYFILPQGANGRVTRLGGAGLIVVALFGGLVMYCTARLVNEQIAA